MVTAGGLLCAALLLSRALVAGLPDPGSGVNNGQGAADPAGTPSILITDRNGRLLYEVIDKLGSKYVPLALEDIPQACREATIATEDSRFYSHPGIDLIAIARAVWQDLRRQSHPGTGNYAFSGASTLTQQLARNLYLSREERSERTLRRKLREAWLAWRLERTHSKDELLALYLNTTYYGHFAVGIEAAAQGYFGVHARELDLAQCALLAGLPQNPGGYNPLENPEAARRRQRLVLTLMAENGYITQAEAELNWGERLAYAASPFPIEAPHFVMWVQSQLEELLGSERVRQGGLRVSTTLDLDYQHLAEKITSRRLAQLAPCAAAGASAVCDIDGDPARKVANAALVALDPSTGDVLAMVGSPDYFDPAISGAVNAALSSRQPGSAIKPITYAAALDPARARAAGEEAWTAATVIADVRTAFPTDEGRPYVPQNYDLRFHGPVTVREALANSYNIPAVKALQYIGIDALTAQARELGIHWDGGPQDPVGAGGYDESQLDSDSIATQPPAHKYGLALTLGGGEVRLLDLTAAYAAFANGGCRVTPRGITRVETLAGEEILDAASSVSQMADACLSNEAGVQRALDERVAYLITDILSDERARLPQFGPGNALEIGRPAAAKTGTTTDWRDNWTVGYTPDLVTGVWVGNADGTPMRDVSGVAGAGPIWRDLMMAVEGDSPPLQFRVPAGLEQVEVCADSGLLPGAAPATIKAPIPIAAAWQPTQITRVEVVPCPSRRLEWFLSGTVSSQVDVAHVRVPLDTRTGQQATALTPYEHIAWETYWVLPPEYGLWARETGFPQPPRQTSWTGSSANSSEAGPTGVASAPLKLASPDPNRVFRLDPLLPANAQQLAVVVLADPSQVSKEDQVSVTLDGASLVTLDWPDYTAWWPLALGEHAFQAVARTADGRLLRSQTVLIRVE